LSLVNILLSKDRVYPQGICEVIRFGWFILVLSICWIWSDIYKWKHYKSFM